MNNQRKKGKINWFVLGLISLALLAVGAFFWAFNLVELSPVLPLPVGTYAA